MSGTRCPSVGDECPKPCPRELACKRVAKAKTAVQEESAIFDFRDIRGVYPPRGGFVSLATCEPVTFARLSGLASAGALLGIPAEAVVRSIRMTQGSSGDEVSIEWALP
jgi:hypothetical protein